MKIVIENEIVISVKCKSFDDVTIVVPDKVSKLKNLNDKDFLLTYIVTEFLKTFDDNYFTIESNVRDLIYCIINIQISLGTDGDLYKVIQLVFEIVDTKNDDKTNETALYLKMKNEYFWTTFPNPNVNKKYFAEVTIV